MNGTSNLVVHPFEFEGDPSAAEAGWEGEVSRSSPDYVRWVQQSLNQIMGTRLAVDGISGSLTRSAVRRFQQRYGLLVDGVVGPQTEAALIATGASPLPGSTAPPAPTHPAPPAGPSQGLAARVVQIALQEWERWGRGSITEWDERVQQVLRDYWETGAGKPDPGPATAWSGAFISWVMRQAGAGSAFAYSSAHTDYVGAAKRNRLANNSNPFKAYRVTEVAPRAGDIVCKERQDEFGNWSGVNYDNVDDGRFRSSHCDIVTAVGQGTLTTIGGNVSNSVKTTPVSTDARGKIPTTSRYYAVIRIEEASPAQEASDWEEEVDGERGPGRRTLGRPRRFGRPPRARRPPIRRPPRPPRRPRRRRILPRPTWGRYGVQSEPTDDQPSPQGSEHTRWVQSSLNQVLGLQLQLSGVMDRDTRSAVRSFQEKHGLPVDGIVGPDTERAMMAARGGAALNDDSARDGDVLESEFGMQRSGSDYIRWVQRSLNRLLGLSLTVSGTSDAALTASIRSFQGWAKLSVDGKMGPITEQAMVDAGADPPPASGDAALVQTMLPREGAGFYSYRLPHRSYGRFETIFALQHVGMLWMLRHPTGPRIGIGEISLRGGGDISGHASHEKGLDVDIRLMRNDGVEDGVTIRQAAYSRSLTQELIDLICDNRVLRVQHLFFNDTRVRGCKKQRWPNHDDHLHVRFYPPSTGAGSELELGLRADTPPAVAPDFWRTWGRVRAHPELAEELDPESPEHTRWLQHALNQVLGLRLAENGEHDRMTRSALRHFQRRHGIAADGELSAETEALLVTQGASQHRHPSSLASNARLHGVGA